MRPIRAAAALVCAALFAGGLAWPSVGAADTSFPAAVGDLAARGEVLVWTPEPSTTPGPLMTGFGSAATPLPVPSARLGGIDVGTDARGRTVLVYSACRTERKWCNDLYLYSFARRSNRRLSLSRPDCAEGSPQISRGVIVFTRGCKEPSPRGKRRIDLYLERPGRPVRRLKRLPRLHEGGLQRRGVASFDLAGRTLAFIEKRVGDELPEGSTWRVVTEGRSLRLGRAQTRLLARARKLESPTSSGTFLEQVRLDDGFVYWRRGVFGGDGCTSIELPCRQDIVRRPIDGSDPAAVLERAERLYAHPPGDTLGNYAVSGDRLYYSFADPPPYPPTAIAHVAGTPVFR